jgi:hypothetical protein
VSLPAIYAITAGYLWIVIAEAMKGHPGLPETIIFAGYFIANIGFIMRLSGWK